jgi:RimJ/RimL family protein N-acetyltransferase
MSPFKATNSYYQLISEKFYFRKVEKTDTDLWLPFFIDNPNLHFLGIDVDISDEEQSAEWINNQLNRYNRDGFGHLAAIDKKTNELIGMGGIIARVIGGKDYLEIAYSVMPKHWGKGYATEMARTALTYGQENLLAKQFISIIHPENKASIRVAKKNGMNFLRSDVFSNIPVNIFSTPIINSASE